MTDCSTIEEVCATPTCLSFPQYQDFCAWFPTGVQCPACGTSAMSAPSPRVIWSSNGNDKINDKELVDINGIDQVAINKSNYNPFMSFDLILIVLICIVIAITMFKFMKRRWVTKNVNDANDSVSHLIEIVDNNNSYNERTALL